MTDIIQRFHLRIDSGVALFVAVFALGLVVLRPAVCVAAAEPTGPVFASVDMSKIIDSYSKRATAEATFQQIQQQYTDIFKTQTANAMLDEDDQKTLGTLLLLGDSATPDQKQQIADLETQAGKASDQLANLQQEKDASDADKVQLQQLTQKQSAGQQALQDVADSYKQALDAKNKELSDEIASEIKAAVATVAKKQGITVVFDSSVAIYASNDLTQAVITNLGGSK
jgi:Skp family chaperone for outer membrane proteins